MKIKDNALNGLIILFLTFCLSGGLLFSPGSSGAEIVDRVAAIVNNEIISLFELNQELKQYSDKIENMGYSPEKERKMLFIVREDILNDLINKILTDQEIKRQKITVGQNEVNSAIERTKKRNFLTDEELRKALKNEGMTIEAYRNKQKDQILQQKLLNYEVKSKIIITDAEIKKYYNSHKDEFVSEKKYSLKKIFVKNLPGAGQAENDYALQRIESARDELLKGESFEDVAAKYSDGDDEGGKVGSFKMEELSPQLKEAIAGLKAGEFTSILKTSKGCQLFFIDKIEGPRGKSIADVKAWVEDKLYRKKVEAKYQEWLSNLRIQSYVRIVR